jgi:hypothetical protein
VWHGVTHVIPQSMKKSHLEYRVSLYMYFRHTYYRYTALFATAYDAVRPRHWM